MSFNYIPEFKKKIVRPREEEGRTIRSITAEYGVSKASISKWRSEFSKGCQSNTLSKDEYCTILDLYRRNVVASITERHVTSNLAIRTLQKALAEHPNIKEGLILHSDRGSQFTSKAFIEFCQSVQITQSMSKAGCPYDNAPIERYFNTLKNECTNLYDFQTEDDLYKAVEEFSYVTYNYLRPHAFNKYQPPCRIGDSL